MPSSSAQILLNAIFASPLNHFGHRGFSSTGLGSFFIFRCPGLPSINRNPEGFGFLPLIFFLQTKISKNAAAYFPSRARTSSARSQGFEAPPSLSTSASDVGIGCEVGWLSPAVQPAAFGFGLMSMFKGTGCVSSDRLTRVFMHIVLRSLSVELFN
jgi:hypothetical protein